ncbi:ParB/RepB/Spo0J family partition protein [Lawsonia intracellularis]|uniref:Predicted transcriptional regulators n=1 Tax=Lawsonia intracellularis (strain PHE/MN1-00) TaxID=363253 RepID=Q1MQ58_LAWIP|nr:ParB/RepB/Spo0J family partition protein [Lawsonia intracellularis]AGC50240.1 ParB-like partition protein [Lawsonia intracellularis N343]KAA0204261.1 ParB/RepB/Spo0J family partition protein [Lawsonia intracellularis]MBZ3892681.1 ParB/RepB/Spo0J family partition protein [Lawsonia intracellularis]RBN33152.1 ParB/RepB/Spo0J family partition protein [Lawsonia intracellularis]RBN35023.1 ParB/RepB/Spo0J family partition protein [Lawsonia intracellularis]
MATQERGLGRGLDILFGNTSPEVEQDHIKKHSKDGLVLPSITKLPIAILRPSSSQPRKSFDKNALEELVLSIKNQGVVQPILVRPYREQSSIRYEIVAGERRWRAAKLAGLVDVPVYIKELNDEDVLTIALIENLQREDLNPIEEALAIESLRKKLSLSQDELAHRLGRSRSAIANTLRLLHLTPEVQEGLCNHTISSGHARALLALSDMELQQVLYKAICCNQLSVRDVETSVTYWKKNGVLPPSISGITKDTVKVKQKERSERLKNVVNTLRFNLHPKVTISGSECMGRITIPYDSQEQFTTILLKLGINASDTIDT